jgi:hypothetical protein
MIALRWILGLSIACLAGGYLLLFFVSNSFRASFHASKNHPLLAILPLAAATLLLAGVLFPASRALLHAGACAAVGIAALCVWFMVRESAVVVWWGIAYAAAWLFFYWRSAFSVSPP